MDINHKKVVTTNGIPTAVWNCDLYLISSHDLVSLILHLLNNDKLQDILLKKSKNHHIMDIVEIIW